MIKNVKIGNIEIGFKHTDMLNANGILQTKSNKKRMFFNNSRKSRVALFLRKKQL